VFREKYGATIEDPLEGVGGVWPRHTSRWWKVMMEVVKNCLTSR